MLSQIEGSSWVNVAQLVGFCLFFVLCVRLRPWRWVSPWFRRG